MYIVVVISSSDYICIGPPEKLLILRQNQKKRAAHYLSATAPFLNYKLHVLTSIHHNAGNGVTKCCQ